MFARPVFFPLRFLACFSVGVFCVCVGGARGMEGRMEGGGEGKQNEGDVEEVNEREG